MKVNKIVIVGGGSSGWMTASSVAYKFPNIDLTLIESPLIGNIGVGESTIYQINDFFDLLDLNDSDWMKQCNATFKNSIQFTDFYKKNTVFQYPFGHARLPNFEQYTYDQPDLSKYLGIFDGKEYFFTKKINSDLSYKDFSRFFNFNAILAETNKQTFDQIDSFNFKSDTAYHFNADLLGNFLKEKYCKNIKHIVHHIDDIETDELGIKSIRIGDQNITADLYIDCSGFKSLLLEKTLNVKFHSFLPLINDSAVTARIEYLNENDKKQNIKNVTDCKAVDYGWIWSIPLWDRIGKGFVYSSQFLTKNQAEEEFRKNTGWTGSVNHINFRHGLHEKAWDKNVISIGLSYAFIEPLESTGLLTTHMNIIKLIDLLKNRECHVNSIDRNLFNFYCESRILNMAHFVSIHYAFSLRDDTDYWKYLTQKTDYDKIADIRHRDLISDISDITDAFEGFDVPLNAGATYVMMGMNYDLVSDHYAKKFKKYNERDFNEMILKYNFVQLVIKKRFEMTESFLSSYDFLKKHIYTD